MTKFLSQPLIISHGILNFYMPYNQIHYCDDYLREYTLNLGGGFVNILGYK